MTVSTKPFVSLSSISSNGKSKIVELFAEAVSRNSDNERFKLIPVRPDWSDATDILGYRNIENKFVQKSQYLKISECRNLSRKLFP